MVVDLVGFHRSSPLVVLVRGWHLVWGVELSYERADDGEIALAVSPTAAMHCSVNTRRRETRMAQLITEGVAIHHRQSDSSPGRRCNLDLS